MRALLSLLLMVLAGSAVAAQCQLVRIAEWPVTLERNQPVIEGAINGKKVGVLLDTGSNTTVIARSAAIRLGLERQYIAGVEAHGVGGVTRVEKTQIDEFRLGQAVREKWDLLVVGEQDFGGDIAVILGEDFFEAVDVEFDLGNHVARLFQPRNCERSPLAYWAPQAPRVEMDVGRSITVRATIDGQPVRATIDTGATRSVLATQVAAQAGITPSTPGVTPGGCSFGIGKKLVDTWIAPMKQFSIGEETIHNPHLFIGDMASGTVYQEIGTRIAKPADSPNMLLGVDFLLAHRVFVSHTQRAVYFTHNGRSPVFDTRPGPTCSERTKANADERIAQAGNVLKERPGDAEALYRRGVAYAAKGDNERALADLDAAIRAGRDDAAVHYWRGVSFQRNRDYDRALADYERALELQPGHLEALYGRSTMLMAKKDYDKAIAGWDSYLEKRPRDPQALASRGTTWFRKGEPQKAYADYDAAVNADPAEKQARRGRGLMLFYDGRYGAAQPDFAQWLRADDSAYAALWLYLARVRAGEDGSRELFDFARGKGGTQWPWPIVRFHLREIGSQELLAAAAQAGDKRKDYECEARFHIAESRLAAADTNGAVPLLRQAVDECPASFDEYFGSRAELKRMAGTS